MDDAEGDESENWEYMNVPIMDEVEPLSGYRPGGFAPVTIGDVLADRFEIIQKLGNGGIAMVWLCWELRTKKWRAVKINSASHSLNDCSDLKALQRMKKNKISQKQLEENHICMALETFWEESPNGRHLCTVLPVLGPRAHDWRTEELRLDAERIRNICYGIAKGLNFLHRNGICHGDFRPQNVLMKLKPGSLDHLSRDDMWELLGAPEVSKVWTISGKRSKYAPESVVTAAPWQRFREFVMDEPMIVDFGESYTPDDPPTHFGVPMRYAAPEVLFQKGRPMLAGDIWSLAITLLELRLDDYGADGPYPVVRKMERFVGPIPIGYRHAARRLIEEDDGREERHKLESDMNSDDHFKPLTGPLNVPRDEEEERDFSGATFSDRLEMKLASEQLAWSLELDPDDPTGESRKDKLVPYYLSEIEVLDLADLLRSMLKYDAKDRVPASQVLQHRWFKKQHPRTVFRHWRYILVVGFFLASLLYLYLTWSGLSCSCGTANRSGGSGFHTLVETCAVTIIFLSLQ
ncbi:kinase-like domain-containing protein [Xylaria nigripes]|nr:kinase-like domain-containing protein [Xylaria nigripes]